MSIFTNLIFFSLLISLLESPSLSFFMLLIVSHVLLLCSASLVSCYSSLVSALVFCLGAIVLLFFSSYSLLAFFISYEFSLLPIAFLIILFGYQPEKISATIFLLSYTIICSLPLFYYVATVGGCVSGLGSSASKGIVFLLGLAFMVKSPLYVLHIWLPKAHVEAPVIGSVLLSGIMLKLGGYGFLLLSPFFNPFFYYFKYLSLSGSVICCILCFRHHDIKSVVAYSSVVHMGAVTIGAIIGSESGLWVSVGIMVSHTLVSPYLFLLAHELYLCSYSRSFLHAFRYGIGASFLLLLSVFWGLNFGVPPFLPFFVEVALFSAIGAQWSLSFVPLILTSLISFLYCVWYYCLTVAGAPSPSAPHFASVYYYLPAPIFLLFLSSFTFI